MTGDGGGRWARELRAWAERPTRLSPQAARTRVLAELSAPRRRPTWRLITAGAALAASALAVGLLLGRRQEPVVPPTPTPTAAAERTIVHQLSSGTRLYIVVRPADPADEC